MQTFKFLSFSNHVCIYQVSAPTEVSKRNVEDFCVLNLQSIQWIDTFSLQQFFE